MNGPNCAICENFSVYGKKICVNGQCAKYMCQYCEQKIHNISLYKGKSFSLNLLECPFCKNELDCDKQKFPIVDANIMDLDNVAWCMKCNYIKKTGIMGCKNNNDQYVNYHCENCKQVNKKFRIKTCQKCNREILKELEDDTCNDVECVCGNHICFFENCIEEFDNTEDCEYHMNIVHGGLYDNYPASSYNDNNYCSKSYNSGNYGGYSGYGCGAIAQLIAHGAQDVYLTGAPKVTYFRTRKMGKHTNFASEKISSNKNKTKVQNHRSNNVKCNNNHKSNHR
mgnify:CR=1 FL=1